MRRTHTAHWRIGNPRKSTPASQLERIENQLNPPVITQTGYLF